MSTLKTLQPWPGGRRCAGRAGRPGAGARRGHLRHQLARPRPSMAASTRRSPTAPMRSTGSRSPSSRAARRPPTARCCSAARSTSTWAALLGAFDAVKEGIPVVDGRRDLPEGPAGPDRPSRRGHRRPSPTSPSSRSIFIGKDGFVTDFQWMKAAYPGFKDEQYKPYTFNPGAVPRRQESRRSRATSPPSPSRSRTQGGFKPKVFLLADDGYDPYSTMIEACSDYVEANPDVVQRFVEASIVGWYNYLYGDNKAANDLIKTRQSRDDRRPDRLLHRQDEGIRHRSNPARRWTRASAA